ncbi:alpha-(1,6)-fucosyltransferase-like [Uloborus diversus]|uniref:alpha-(1,6)-fucosyltransferase-like n=1 Tax=Uloborus diversus TaxID=327109 RepID=UPI00240A71DC|nr:alpha-(1,6)-fucosyltransferase-like [Uloborus diversus]
MAADKQILQFNGVIDIELFKLARADGWNEWRKNEAKNLNDIVHSRIAKLQNPKDCSKAPVLICNLTNPYGFASGVHDVLWCFVKAYKEQRRLVLITAHWHYAPGGWTTLFQPLSDTCSDENITAPDKNSQWPGDNNNRARWLLRTLPKDLGPRILRLHENPLAWWYGQFLKYLMRPNHQLNNALNRVFQDLNFTKGVLGIHVRRTDKVGTEAIEHHLVEYMKHVEEHFQGTELLSEQSVERRVYIATDDPRVIQECSAEVASKLETRYSNSSLWSLVIDILALSKSDFIVCTLSSGICRLAYELKVATDESFVINPNQIISLDIPHHYAWVLPASRKAMYNHKSKSPKEMAFQKGDILVYKDEYCTVNAALKGKTTNGLTYY